jgi:hypothetical protein
MQEDAADLGFHLRPGPIRMQSADSRGLQLAREPIHFGADSEFLRWRHRPHGLLSGALNFALVWLAEFW